jgi:hypothetical protein
VEIGKRYLAIIAERPYLGLLETEGESFLRSESTGQVSTHNGYLETLYLGGITYAMPVFFLVAYTGWCTVRTWKYRRLIGVDPLLINLLVALMVMTYAHGFVNSSLYYPTTNLAFFHVLLSVVFMGLARDLTRAGQPLGPPGDETVDLLDEVDYDDYSHDDAAETAS